MIHYTRVHFGLFDFSVEFYVGNYEQAIKYANDKFETPDEGLDSDIATRGYEPRGQCLFRRGYVPIVWIPRRPVTSREHATLAHECIHAVMHLFEWVSLDVNRETEEVFAHAVAHLIDGFMENKLKVKS